MHARTDATARTGYVFTTTNTGRDYVYKLVSINGVPFGKHDRAYYHLQIAKEAVATFDVA